MKPHRLKQKIYRWSGLDTTGKKRQGEITAATHNLAMLSLQQQGITAAELRKKRPRLRLARDALSQRANAIFYRQLATLIKAGIPLTHCLQILSQQQDHPVLQTLIQSLRQTLEAGLSLSSGLRLHPRHVDPLTCHLIEVAEQTGTLDVMLTRISHYKEQSLMLQNQIKQALFYPGMIILVAILVSLTMLLFVVPRFAEMFANFHAELPLFTLMVVHFSNFIRHYYGWGILPVLLAYGGFVYAKKQPPLQLALQQYQLQIPVLKTLLKKFLYARFTRTLATLIVAGIPITDGLKILIHNSHNNVFKIAIHTLQLDITHGLRLHQAMQMNPLFPAMMTQMIQVGEESGSLDTMLEKIAEFYESEIDYWLKNFSNILEPLIIIILGVLIGGLVIAIYLPIFKLGTVI